MRGLDELRFHDGAPFADAETRAWISARVMPLVQPAQAPSEAVNNQGGATPAWEEALQHVLPHLRKDGLKSAVQKLKLGLNQARGGRERFFWQLTLARLCFQAKKYDLARTQLESLDQTLQAQAFKPSTGGAQEELELPLKLMVLGDFTQRPDDRKIEDRKPIAIDKNSFDEVLAFQTHPRLLRSQRCIHTPIYASSQRGSDVRFQQKAATPLRSLALDSRILVAAPCAGTSER